MRLASIYLNGQQRVARSEGDDLIVLPETMCCLATLLQTDDLARAAASKGQRIRKEGVDFLPPIPRPEKIICVGLNFQSHVSETSAPALEQPSLFVRFPSSQVGHRVSVIAPRNSEQFDYEGELAVIIGKPARHVSREQAMTVVGGYSCFAENSVRDFQFHSRQATPGKNFHASGAMGPWMTTPDEVGDPATLEIRTRVNGEQRQHGLLTDLIFPIDYLISYISSFAQLLPGDVIVTGTPGGVGLSHDPRLWLKPGDEIEIEIDRVGTLINPVSAEA